MIKQAVFSFQDKKYLILVVKSMEGEWNYLWLVLFISLYFSSNSFYPSEECWWYWRSHNIPASTRIYWLKCNGPLSYLHVGFSLLLYTYLLQQDFLVKLSFILRDLGEINGWEEIKFSDSLQLGKFISSPCYKEKKFVNSMEIQRTSLLFTVNLWLLNFFQFDRTLLDFFLFFSSYWCQSSWWGQE